MTRTERIETLLYHYVDVENGLQDRAFRGDDFLPRMCRSWNHPSYVELRRLIGYLQQLEPRLYWHLSQKFFKYEVRRVARCPRCTAIYPASMIGGMHKHGQRGVELRPHPYRAHLPVNDRRVRQAIEWLAERFVGEPFIPDDLLLVAA